MEQVISSDESLIDEFTSIVFVCKNTTSIIDVKRESDDIERSITWYLSVDWDFCILNACGYITIIRE